MQNHRDQERRADRMSGNARTVRAVVTFLAVVAAYAVPALWTGGGAALAQLPCGYEVVAVIQAPAGPFHSSPTVPLSISPDGRYVVGYYNFDAVAQARGWYYEMPNGPFTALPHPPGMFTSYAEDVNNAGQICGKIAGTSGDFGFVFDLHTGVYTLMPPSNPGGTCSANSINASGTVCGTRSLPGGPEPTYPTTGFVWSSATGFQDIGLIDGWSTGLESISETGFVVGWRGAYYASSVTLGLIGPLAAPQILPVIPTGTTSSCVAVNAKGDICGFGRTQSSSGAFNNRVFCRSGKSMMVVGLLPGYLRSFANDISDDGVVVGSCKLLEATGQNVSRGCVWYDAVPHDVNEMIEGGGKTYVSAVNGISTDGTLTCVGYAEGVDDLTVVLRPSTHVGDLTADCVVNVSDLLLVVVNWGSTNLIADANGDGVVNVGDLIVVITNWT